MFTKIKVAAAAAFVFLILSGCASGSVNVSSLKNLPPEIDMKNLPTSDQYPESDGVVLYENTVFDIDYVPRVGIETYKTFHKVYRVFRNEDEFMANFMTFDDKTVFESFSGRTIKSDGTVIDLKQEDIYSGINVRNYKIFTGKNYWISYNFPKIQKGDIIEIKYKVVSSYFYFSDTYNIQSTLPKKYSRFEILMPEFVFGSDWQYEFNYKAKNIQIPAPAFKKGFGESGDRSYVWENRDIPAFKAEPYSGPDYLYKGFVELQLAYWNTWNGYARDHYDRNYKPVLDDMSSKDKEKVKEKVKELTAGITDELGKIKALTKFVQTFRYTDIGVYFGNHFKPNEIGLIFEREYGDCKDHAVLLVAMLREMGVKASPALIRAEDPTGVDPKFVTDIFNHAIVKATLDGGQVLWLDPTSKFAAFGRLPEGDEDTFALELKPKNNDGNSKVKLERTPKSNYSDSLIEKIVKGKVENGAVKFEVSTKFFGNIANYSRHEMENLNNYEMERIVRRNLPFYLYDAAISNISVKNIYDTELPLILSCNIEFKIPENRKIPVVAVTFFDEPVYTNRAYLIDRKRPVVFPTVYATKETYEMNFDPEKYNLPDFENINKEIVVGNSNKWKVTSKSEPGKISFSVEYAQKEKIVKTEDVPELLKKVTDFSMFQWVMYTARLVPKAEESPAEKIEEITEEKVEIK